MAKVRVHELAKKYDVPSKDVLTMLGELGEFVKAPSSTVEPPVVKRFEDKYGADLSAQAEVKAAKKAAKKAPAKKAADGCRDRRGRSARRGHGRGDRRDASGQGRAAPRSPSEVGRAGRGRSPGRAGRRRGARGPRRERGDRDRGRLRRRRRAQHRGPLQAGSASCTSWRTAPGQQPVLLDPGHGSAYGSDTACRWCRAASAPAPGGTRRRHAAPQPGDDAQVPGCVRRWPWWSRRRARWPWWSRRRARWTRWSRRRTWWSRWRCPRSRWRTPWRWLRRSPRWWPRWPSRWWRRSTRWSGSRSSRRPRQHPGCVRSSRRPVASWT